MRTIGNILKIILAILVIFVLFPLFVGEMRGAFGLSKDGK
jgi:hypothetical protein